MPQNSPITIADGQTTPANHVFNPKGQTGSGREYVFRDTKASVIEYGQAALLFDKRPIVSSSPTDKTVIRVQVPKVVSEVVNGVTQDVVAYTNLCTVELVVSKTATASEKKDLIAYAKNVLASSFVASMVVDGETIW